MSRHVVPDLCVLGGIALTWLGYLTVRALRRANRVIAEAPRSNVVPLTTRNGVRVVPQQQRRGESA